MKSREMKPFRERNPVVVGAISLVVLALTLVAALQADDLPIIGGGDTDHAMLTEAGGLKVDDEVRIAGVRVGKVDEIELAGDEVRVSFKVDDAADFGGDTRAAIKVKTILGAMFLALEPAGGGRLAEGATIPAARTSSPFDVVEAFEGLASTSEQIDTDQLAESLTTLADLTRNTPEEFRGALDGLSRLSSNIAAKDEQLNTLLVNLERVSTVLDERDQDIITLMEDSDVLFRALVARREAVHDLLVSSTTLSKELTLLIEQSREDLKPALAHLENVVAVLNKNEDNLDSSLRLMAPFYRVFANTLGTGPWFDTWISNFPPVPQVG
jgi:phospholipid/cholesterol/gamma-HCH transport system substrate-binding protein